MSDIEVNLPAPPASDESITAAHYEMAQHEPVFKVVDGRVFCDGVHVFEEQLSEEELKRFLPEKYYAKYGSSLPVKCPICDGQVKGGDKRGIIAHVRQKHPDEFEEFGQLKEFIAAEDGRALVEVLRSIYEQDGG